MCFLNRVSQYVGHLPWLLWSYYQKFPFDKDVAWTIPFFHIKYCLWSVKWDSTYIIVCILTFMAISYEMQCSVFEYVLLMLWKMMPLGRDESANKQ